jgi:hypothetical protein
VSRRAASAFSAWLPSTWTAIQAPASAAARSAAR